MRSSGNATQLTAPSTGLSGIQLSTNIIAETHDLEGKEDK